MKKLLRSILRELQLISYLLEQQQYDQLSSKQKQRRLPPVRPLFYDPRN